MYTPYSDYGTRFIYSVIPATTLVTRTMAIEILGQWKGNCVSIA